MSRAAVAVFLLTPLAAWAQTAIPGVIDPGHIEQRLDLPPTGGELSASVPALDTSEIVAPEQAANIRFKLLQLRISGASVYDAGQLHEYYAAYIGKTISLKIVYTVIDSIIQRYRSDGYALVSAIIPAQNFKTGDIEIRVVEGYVSKVRLTEGPGLTTDPDLLAQGQLARYANNIRGEQPLTRTTLIRNLLLANDIPGITADGGFRRSQTTLGAADLGLKVQRDSFSTFGSINNYGPEELGPTQFQVGAEYNGLFRVGDSSSIRLGGTPDMDTLRYLFLSHSQTFGAGGLRLGANLGYVKTRPELDNLSGLEGTAKVVSLSARYPWLRSLEENLFLYGSLDYVNTDNAFLQRSLTSDRLRSLRLGAYYSVRDHWGGNDWVGDNSVNLALSQGLNVLGAGGNSRPDGRTDYTKLNFYLQRLQRFGGAFEVQASVSGQYSFHKLLSPETYGYGGREFGRAFRPSEITGDHGLAVALELRYHKQGVSILRSYEPYLFVDAGKVWRIDDRFTLGQLAAASAGGGVRLEFSDYFTIELEAAKAIHRSVNAIGEDDWQFFIRFTGES